MEDSDEPKLWCFLYIWPWAIQVTSLSLYLSINKDNNASQRDYEREKLELLM